MAEVHTLSLTVNGHRHTDQVEPQLLLANYLRDTLNLTGTHVGCDTSQCGACTVLVDGRAVKSCTMLAVQADGSAVITIEGLASDGRLHPVQEAFTARHALQCGFCTSGAIMTAVGLLNENPHPSPTEIREGLDGVICRCTGYENIVSAIAHAADLLAADPAATGVR